MLSSCSLVSDIYCSLTSLGCVTVLGPILKVLVTHFWVKGHMSRSAWVCTLLSASRLVVVVEFWLFLIGIDFSAKAVYVREDEWLMIQQHFTVDVELRREVIVDDVGRDNVVLIPGTMSKFLIVSHVWQSIWVTDFEQIVTVMYCMLNILADTLPSFFSNDLLTQLRWSQITLLMICRKYSL